MKVFAYCATTFTKSVRKAAGVEPLTFPPLTEETFDYRWLERADLLYFDLHGRPGEGMWYGDNRVPALRAEEVAKLSLPGVVVFALSCYLGDDDSPILDAFLAAGVQYVIGGDGLNWGPAQRPTYGASLLGLWFRMLVSLGLDPLKSLAMAKMRVKLTLSKDKVLGRKSMVKAAEDTLAFKAYYRPV